jgi:hypothetical protein
VNQGAGCGGDQRVMAQKIIVEELIDYFAAVDLSPGPAIAVNSHTTYSPVRVQTFTMNYARDPLPKSCLIWMLRAAPASRAGC